MAVYRFARCELDSDQHRLRVAGIERHIEPQVFDLLHFLLQKGDAIATREELIERVWKGRVVSDSAISVRINAARKVVGDTGSRQDVIRTVPRRGFRLAVDVTRVEHATAPEASIEQSSKPVVGIFPFDASSENLPTYLVRGIAEDIATELSRFHSIEVVSPYSTFRHDFSVVDQFEVARSLGVSHLVTGSFNGNKSVQRLNVRLLDANGGSNLWSERYDIRGDDLFTAQDDAVLHIVSALAHGLTEHQSDIARRKPTRSLSAYECLLRGLDIYKWGVNSLDKAKQAMFWFDRAIDLDPDYARARAWRECCNSCFWSSPPADSEIESSARRMQFALALDENDHEVHRLKGSLHLCAREHALGEYHLAKSVELNPNDAHILIKIGMYRSFLAQNTDDLTYVDTAFARNPLHPAWYWGDRGITLFAHGDYDQSISNLLRSNCDNEISALYLAAAYALLDRLDEAKPQIEKLHAMNPGANIDWFEVAYPTRCYEDSECRNLFLEGLHRAGL
jgi:DNA-binding winged helix-turn-helix (wHTH) protein/Flp pilus assembly protein TadD